MTFIRNLLLSVLLFAAATASAQAPKVAIGDFFKDPEFTSVSLSPTGEFLTVSVPQGDRTVLAAFKVSDMSLVGKWDYGEKRHIDRVRWVNDRRFVMYVTRKVGRFDARIGTADLYATDVDGNPLSISGFTVAGDGTSYTAGQTATIAGVGALTINVNPPYIPGMKRTNPQLATLTVN